MMQKAERGEEERRGGIGIMDRRGYIYTCMGKCHIEYFI